MRASIGGGTMRDGQPVLMDVGGIRVEAVHEITKELEVAGSAANLGHLKLDSGDDCGNT
jgi:hypothetical protein